MQIGPLFNTEVTIEEGDLYALEEGKLKEGVVLTFILIRSNGELYRSVGGIDKNNIGGTYYVNSAGDMARHSDLVSKLEWKIYMPKDDLDRAP